MTDRIAVETMESALDPKGIDKMPVDSSSDVTITSHRHIAIFKMDFEHPLPSMMKMEIAKIN